MTTKKLSSKHSKKAISTSQKSKIQKKMRDHNKKMRREAKKLKSLGKYHKKKTTKDVKVPNANPFKKNILEDFKNKKQGAKVSVAAEETGQEGVVLDHSVGVVYESKPFHQIKAEGKHKEPKVMPKPLNAVIEAVDVVLQVLDARNPLATRSRFLEDKLRNSFPSKKLVLVLNKADLVPKETAQAWKDALSAEYPTVLFHSDTTKDIQSVINLVEQFRAEREDLEKTFAIGVVGLPFVGKTYVINALAHRKAGSLFGSSKSTKTVEVTSGIEVLDSQGLVHSAETEIADLLRFAIAPKQITNLNEAVHAILQTVGKDKLLRFYKIADFASHKELLEQVANAQSRFLKGGVPDLQGAAKEIVLNWFEGKIKHFVIPTHS